jgi:hypothetical protein
MISVFTLGCADVAVSSAADPDSRVQPVMPAKMETAQTPDTAKEDDPVE